MEMPVNCFRWIIISTLFLHTVKGICTWPDTFQTTNWTDNVEGTLSFSSQTVTGWQVVSEDKTISSWQCHLTDWYQSHNLLVLRSEETVILYESNFNVYLCLSITEITTNSYRYYIYNTMQANLNQARAHVALESDLQDIDALCYNTTTLQQASRPGLSEYRVMIKSGMESSAKVDCPYLFLGKYDYTHTATTGTVTCSDTTDTLDMCTEHSHMAFSYDTCSTKVSYSTSDTVWCVDTVPVNGDNYITLYNGNDATVDDSNTFRFTCVAVSEDGTAASVSPNNCKSGQTPSSMPIGSTAATLTLTQTEACVTCPRLTDPAGGNVSYSTDGAVTTAWYQCSELYSLAGSPTRTCQDDLTWSLEPATCTCIVPEPPSNGSVQLSTDGLTITYFCDIGFALNGSETRTCSNSSNTWSDTAPVCVECTAIGESAGMNSNKSIVGTSTVSQFTCDAGYTLMGTSNSTCLSDGSWEPAIPACVQCGSQSDPTSGSRTVTTDGYTSTAVFTCSTSYYLVGSASLTCSTQGTWNGTEPSCYCDDPDILPNGTYTANGTHVMYTCDEGFNIEGSTIQYCSSDGSGWSDSAPTCEYCGSIAVDATEYYNLSTDGATTQATFSCVAGYTLSGQRTITCQTGSAWTKAHTCVTCGSVTAPSSGSVSISTNGTISVATYTCAQDYSMSGTSVSYCSTDGSWLTQPPTCYCSPVSNITYGQVVSDDGQEAYYTCDLGYTLDGSSVRTCSDNSTGWSDTDPTCVSCPALVSVTGGQYIQETDGTVTRAVFTCSVGYTINGKITLTCQTNGTWDNTQPSCSACATLADVAGGNVTLYSESETVTKASYSCQVGYTLSGSSLLTCDSSGQWDLSPPTCAQCTERSAPSSGYVNFTTDGQTTTATYSCATDYTLVGTSSIDCKEDGNWRSPSPSCECTTPAAPVGGSVSADGATVTYTCDVGSTLSGDTTGSCQTDGSGWSINTPVCVTCEAISNITDGNLTLVTDGATTRAVYTCTVGGTLVGGATVNCNSSGSWEMDQPQCVKCPALASISSGSLDVRSNGTVTTAVYSCTTGYHLSGTSQLTCTDNGTWSSTEPECLCDAPSTPSGGTYIVSEDGQTVSFTCDLGYTLDGIQNISCSTDGTGWNISTPTCVVCPDLSSPAAGNVTLVTTGTKTEASYTCDVGYTMDGSAYTVCQTDGSWNASAPSCISCPSLTAISSGNLSLSTDGLITTGTYSCANQYELDGTATVTCTTSGTWDNNPPDCYCVVPAPPDNGNVTVSEDRSTLTYACMAGYILDGTSVRTCQSDSLGWTLTAPTCVTCSNLESPSNGNVSLTTDGSVTIAIYMCDLGYSMAGDSEVTCQSDGTWAGQIPTCVQCENTSVASGTVTMTTDGLTTSANYTCSTGYHLEGQSYLTCNASGVWSSEQPTCLCDNVLVPTNGNVSYSVNSSVVTYSCDVGYSLDGAVVRTCRDQGQGWDNADPTCVQCELVVDISNSSYTVASNGTHTSVQYQCDQGTSLSGSSSLDCQSTGTWNEEEPECVVCPSLADLDSGVITVTTDGITTSAVYTCSAGYQTSDNTTTLQCQTDGSWSTDQPTCQCIPPSAPTNGSVAFSQNDSVVTYTCDLYFTILGDTTRVCQTGGAGWNGSQPTCVQCAVQSAPVNGSIVSNTTGTQTQSVFTCNPGTSMNGEPVSQCQTDGTWSSDVPTCVSCTTPPDPDSGQVTISTISSETVTIATFTCVSGYQIVGDSNLTCSSDGQWSRSFPTCVCADPVAVTNGAIVTSGQSASYTCKNGYTLDGLSTRTCQGSGQGWTGQDPTCVQCDTLMVPTNGSMELGTNGTMTTAGFQCGVGTSLNGSQLLTCSSNGSWDTTAPSCVICGSLGVPANGEYLFTSDGSTTTGTLQCGGGYEVRGITTLSCQSDGTWTSQGQGYCEKTDSADQTVSYLTALIVVSVVSALVITILSILLAVFVRRHCQGKDPSKYRTGIADSEQSSVNKNGRISHLDKDTDNPFTVPNGKCTPSIAPASHQRHVLDAREGTFVSSPAPSGHGRHVTDNGSSPTPRSMAPLETDRSVATIYLDKSSTNVTLASVASLSKVEMIANKPPNRLQPLSAHKKLMGKIQLSPSPKQNGKLHVPSPNVSRCSTPVNHALKVTDDKDDTISDVCN